MPTRPAAVAGDADVCDVGASAMEPAYLRLDALQRVEQLATLQGGRARLGRPAGWRAPAGAWASAGDVAKGAGVATQTKRSAAGGADAAIGRIRDLNDR